MMMASLAVWIICSSFMGVFYNFGYKLYTPEFKQPATNEDKVYKNKKGEMNERLKSAST